MKCANKTQLMNGTQFITLPDICTQSSHTNTAWDSNWNYRVFPISFLLSVHSSQKFTKTLRYVLYLISQMTLLLWVGTMFLKQNISKMNIFIHCLNNLFWKLLFSFFLRKRGGYGPLVGSKWSPPPLLAGVLLSL